MRALIDHIESGIATLLLGEQESVKIMLPTSLLPSETHEGDVLKIAITIDRDATNKGKDAVQKLLDSLQGES